MKEYRRGKQVKKILYKKQETKRQTEAKETNKRHHIIRKNILLSRARKKGSHINSRRKSRQEDKDKSNEECDTEKENAEGE